MAAQATLTIYQGDDYAADVLVMQADGVTPADLTGYTAQSQIRLNAGDNSPDAVAEFTAAITGNTISLSLSNAATSELTKSTYAWDVQIIGPDGWITTLLYGAVQVLREVTKVYATRAGHK